MEEVYDGWLVVCRYILSLLVLSVVFDLNFDVEKLWGGGWVVGWLDAFGL